MKNDRKSWTKDWMTHRGLVRMVAHDQTMHQGQVVRTKWDGGHPRMAVACDDGRVRWTHPQFVWPIGCRGLRCSQ
jgi:hypothetical protein